MSNKSRFPGGNRDDDELDDDDLNEDEDDPKDRPASPFANRPGAAKPASPFGNKPSDAPKPGGPFGSSSRPGGDPPKPGGVFGTGSKPASGFGNKPNDPPKSPASPFGNKPSDPPKPGGVFGSGSSGNAGSNRPSDPPRSTGAFGSSSSSGNRPADPPKSGGAFGSGSSGSAAGNRPGDPSRSTGAFGSGSSGGSKPNDPPKPGGIFGGGGSKPDDPPKSGSVFGSGSRPSDPPKSGGSLFGGNRKDDTPADKPASPKLDSAGAKPGDKPAGGGPLGGLGGRFGIGGKKDEPPSKPGTSPSAPKLGTPPAKPADKPAGGGPLGGLGARLPFGKKDDAPPAKPGMSPAAPKSGTTPAKPGDKPAGNVFGNLASRLPFGKKDDGKGSAKPGDASKTSSFGSGSSSSSALRSPTTPGYDPRKGTQTGSQAGVKVPPGRTGDKTAKPLDRSSTQFNIKNHGLSLDQKLDLVGYALIIASLLIFGGILQPSEGTITSTFAKIFGQAFGYGRLVWPIGFLLAGGWLLVRHFKENPFLEIDHVRVVGLVILFVTGVVTLQFFELLPKPVTTMVDLAVLSSKTMLTQTGGGWLGDKLYMLLMNIVDQWSLPVLLFGFWIGGVMMAFQIELSEMALYIKSIFRFFGRVRNGFADRRRVHLETQAAKATAAAPLTIEKPLTPASATLSASSTTLAGAGADKKGLLEQATSAPGVPRIAPGVRKTQTTDAAQSTPIPAPAASLVAVAEEDDKGRSPLVAQPAPPPLGARPTPKPGDRPFGSNNLAANNPTVGPSSGAVSPAKAGSGVFAKPIETPKTDTNPGSRGDASKAGQSDSNPPADTGSRPAASGASGPAKSTGGVFGKPAEPAKTDNGSNGKDSSGITSPATPVPAGLSNAAPASKPGLFGSLTPAKPSSPFGNPFSAAKPADKAPDKQAPPADEETDLDSEEADLANEPPAKPIGTMGSSSTGLFGKASLPSVPAKPSPFGAKPTPANDDAGDDEPEEDVDLANEPPAKPIGTMGSSGGSGLFGKTSPANPGSSGPFGARPSPFGAKPQDNKSGDRPAAISQQKDDSKPDQPTRPNGPTNTTNGGSGSGGTSSSSSGIFGKPAPTSNSSPFGLKPAVSTSEIAKDAEAVVEDDLPLKPATPIGNRFGSPSLFSAPTSVRPVPKPGVGSASDSKPDAKPEDSVDDVSYVPLDDEPVNKSDDNPVDKSFNPVPPPNSPLKSPFGAKPGLGTPVPTQAATPVKNEVSQTEPVKPELTKAEPIKMDVAPLNGSNGKSDELKPDTAPATPITKEAASTVVPAMATAPVTTVSTLSNGSPGWTLPNVQQLLETGSTQQISEDVQNQRARLIEETLSSFGAPGKVVETHAGPVITQFGVEPDYLVSKQGKRTRVKVSAIARLDADLALALAARSIRIEAPVPGKGYVGIEVPNAETAVVGLRDIMSSEKFRNIKSRLRIALGKSVDGDPTVSDLTAMPHLLIAGTTGSGKSVCVNAIISCLLLENSPDDLKFIMVDPKRVELTGYNGIPHLISPVVVDLERIVGVLKWVTREMDERYKKFSAAGARNLIDYNSRIGPSDPKLPYLVVVIDELADLMMLAPEETEKVLTRLAQMARATGIHLILSTQRPSVDVVTGLIKANFPARISFAVASSVDSRVILDQPGAEKLLGRGDMLYQAPDAPAPMRVQGVYVSDAEINHITRYWKEAQYNAGEAKGTPASTAVAFSAVEKPADPIQSRTDKFGGPMRVGAPAASGMPAKPGGWTSLDKSASTNGEGDDDEMYNRAVDLFKQKGMISSSLLQRNLRINDMHATRLIKLMKQRGVLGAPDRRNNDAQD